MDYKGNLKGDALKHYKWKGRRKSPNVMKGGNPNGSRLVELKKEQQRKREMKKTLQKSIEQKRLEQERRAREEIIKEVKEEIEVKRKIKEVQKEIEMKRKEDGFVKVKAFIRKLANGTIINVRSFLRRVAKKLKKNK